MKNRIILIFLGCMACEPYIDTSRSLQEGNDTGLTRKVAYVSHTPSELVFDADVSLLEGYGDQYDRSYLTQGAFTFEGAGTYTILSFKTPQISSSGKSSTIVIEDQSGSYSETDPENRRSKSLDKFFYDVKAPNDFILAASAKGGQLAPEPLEEYRTDFTADAEGQVPYLFGLAKRTGGKCAILDAMSLAIDRLASSTGAKNIVALVHGPDVASAIDADALITKAATAQVRLSVVLLAKADVATGFAKISQTTGGLFSVCPSENEMVTTFNHLYRMLNDVSTVYRIRIKYVPTSGTLVSGAESLHTLKVRYEEADFDYNPVELYMKIP